MISLDSVLHFTKKFEDLQSILSNGFKVTYCNERLCFKDLEEIDVAIPMISFSDILLEQIPNQISSYGSYGIGLRKSWAVSQKLNPVLYVEKNSVVSEILKNQAGSVKPNEKNDNIAALLQHWHLLAFIKNYEGDLDRDGVIIENYRFYDEREWRYVASRELLFGDANFYKGTYYQKNKSDLKNSPLTILNFTCSDLTHLFVTSEEEKEALSATLEQIYKIHTSCDLDYLKSLITIKTTSAK